MRSYRRAAAAISLVTGALIAAAAHAQSPPTDGATPGAGSTPASGATPGAGATTDPASGATPGAGATTGPASGSSLLNPNISVIGWFQGTAGDQNDEEGSAAFELREAELGFQAMVDPYSRADFFVAVSPEEGVDLEEGTLTFLALPAGFTGKLGKFRSNFGKFNRTHPPETPFADRPLATERFLGEEGLAVVGLSASWLAPLPFYLNLDGEVSTTPDAGESPAFEAYRGKDLLYLGRASAYFDLSEATNLTLGASVANGADGPDSSSAQGPDVPALRATLVGADLTFRWKDPRRAIYRSFLAQGEWMSRRASVDVGPDETVYGGFAYVDLQFARRWHAGARADWCETLEDPTAAAQTGVLGFLTFNPSEFASLSLQVRDQTSGDGDLGPVFFFKTTFSIGPHGQHPF